MSLTPWILANICNSNSSIMALGSGAWKSPEMIDTAFHVTVPSTVSLPINDGQNGSALPVVPVQDAADVFHVASSVWPTVRRPSFLSPGGAPRIRQAMSGGWVEDRGQGSAVRTGTASGQDRAGTVTAFSRAVKAAGATPKRRDGRSRSAAAPRGHHGTIAF